MAKRLFAIVGLFLLLTAFAAAGVKDEKKLLALVPAGAEGVLSLDTTEWFQLPALREGLLKSRELDAIPRGSGLQITDLGALVFWWKGDDWTLLSSWSKPFDPMRVFRAPLFVCGKVDLAGETIYSVTSVEKVRPDKKKRAKRKSGNLAFWCAGLPGNCVGFFSDSASAFRALKLMKGRNKGFTFPMQASGTFRGVMQQSEKLPFQGALLSCRMTGSRKDEFSGFLSVTARTPEEAANWKAQGMMMLNLMLVQTMQDDPQLASDLVRCLKFDSVDRNVTLTANISAPLLKRLGTFCESQTKKYASRKVRSSGKKGVPPKNAAPAK